ncbi:MAG: BatD family protein [Saprospirales bacterium]|nr:BatD family protein [Saprospirales bacterium]
MTLVRLALFPQRTGNLEIPPLTILLDVGERRSNPFGLGLAPVERLRISSNPLTIKVLPFPEDKPQTFSGAVGKYTFSSEVNRTELSTDDALSVKLFINGDGDIKQVGIPPLTGVDSFEVFDPNVLSEVLKDSGNGYLTGEKVIEYLLTPKSEGVYDIPLEFSYWDPDSNAYVISRQAPLHISVQKGSNRPSIATGPSANDKDEVLLPMLTSTRLQYRGRYWINSPLFWGLGSLPFLALLGLTLFRRWQTREERMDPLLVRERRTRRVVDQHLSTARGHLQAGQFQDLFEEISRALMAYLGHKLSIPPALWSKARVREQLAQADVPEPITSQVLEILQTCEMALYAGQDKQEVAQKVFDQASDVIRQMEDKK